MESLANDPRIVFIGSIVHPKDLCCLEASIDVLDKRHSSAKSAFHFRILKCRQLIFGDEHVIASPALETETEMHIIMGRKYFESGEITEKLKKLKILAKDPSTVPHDIFEKCLRYTILTKIAPSWNLVKNYLVCGRSFLTRSEALLAVKLNICIKDTEAFIIVWPLRVRLEQTKLEDFGITQEMSQDFARHSISMISEKCIESPWVHVLPIFAKGQIMQITHQIPETCPYRTYTELRRHWKNMYGYRLSKEENNLAYYTVSLHFMNNSTNLTFPSVCIRAHDIVLMNQIDPFRTLELFHDMLLKKMPTFCGHNIFSNINLAYAISKEDEASLNIYFNTLKLSNTHIKLSELIEQEPVIFSSALGCKYELISSILETGNLDNHDVLQEDNLNSTSDASNVSSSSDKLTSPDSGYNEEFTQCIPENKSTVSCDTAKSCTVPPRKPLQDIPHVLNLKNIQNWPNTINRCDVESKASPISSRKSVYNENCPSDTHFIQTTLSRIALSAQKIEAVVSSSSSQSMQSFYPFPTQNMLMEQTRVSSQTCLTFKDILSSGNQQVNIISSNGQTLIPEKEVNLKRDASLLGQNDISGLVKKKPRSRPQVQLDVDVELVARNNDLQRVNKITLVYWLRNKLVPCKVKDKKSDLVIKVMEYLKLPLENGQ